MHEPPGPDGTGDASEVPGVPGGPPRGWLPDDTTPHTYDVPSSGAPAPEAPLPPVYGHPMPSLSRRRRGDGDADRDGHRPSLWLRLRRALGRVR